MVSRRSPKKIFGVIPALILFAAVAAAQPPAHGKQQSLTGTVSDAMCGAKHMQEGSAADCTRVCVKGGSKYALVVGDKVYTLNGHEEELDKLAGQKVTVTGKVKGETVEVASVKGA